MKRKLVLENGMVFEGHGFGAVRSVSGEVVFTTAMTGYQELLTDPSFLGQIVVMTFPMIGNYGVNRDDYESIVPHVSAFVVGEACEQPSNFRSEMTLDAYLKKHDIPGLYGIDTRALTRAIREKGAVRGILADEAVTPEEALALLQQQPQSVDHIARVSTRDVYEVPGKGKRVVLYDYGMKGSILKNLAELGFQITVVPFDYPARAALDLNPHGIFLSNGPGDPQSVPQSVAIIRELLGQVPMFGICMGHQLLALACGAKTRKMGFGHRGGNHPVRDLRSGRILITSQNHGYVVDDHGLDQTMLVVTHRSVNDNTVEGIAHRDLPARSVQFHPEAAPGPQDASVIFKEFATMMEGSYVNR